MYWKGNGFDSDINGTNESYFNALPGGYVSENGYPSDLYTNGYWWSTTEHPWGGDYTGAWSLHLNGTDNYVHIEGKHKGEGLSVRCIKD
jgi:uncharacterized protein (TIGR02145 family)